MSGPREDFDLIVDMMVETGELEKRIEFLEYVDLQFAEGARRETAWKCAPGSQSAK